MKEIKSTGARVPSAPLDPPLQRNVWCEIHCCKLMTFSWNKNKNPRERCESRADYDKGNEMSNVRVKFTHTLSYATLPVWVPLTKSKIMQRKFCCKWLLVVTEPFNIAINDFDTHRNLLVLTELVVTEPFNIVVNDFHTHRNLLVLTELVVSRNQCVSQPETLTLLCTKLMDGSFTQIRQCKNFVLSFTDDCYCIQLVQFSA